MKTNLWLDDLRKPLDPSYIWVKTVSEAIDESSVMILADNQRFDTISLDHDLGENADGGDAINYLKWMISNNFWPRVLNLHSMNPVGLKNMWHLAQDYAPRECTISINANIIKFEIDY